MKKVILMLMALMMSLTAFSKSGEAKQMTKFEEFSSKTGSIIKFVDYKLPNLPKKWTGALETGIRVIKASQEDKYFYRLVEHERGSSLSYIAMIEYSDLVEINKALERLTSEVESDAATKPYYLENKFSTEDGFVVGYCVDKGSVHWFLKLEYSESSFVAVSNQDVLVESFKNAQIVIEGFKAETN